MPTAIEVKVSGLTEVNNLVKNLPIKADKIGNLEAWNLTQFGASQLIQSAENIGIEPWRGRLLTYGSGIKPRKIGKGRYGIFVPYYGIELDQWRGGFKPVNRGTLFEKWTKEKGFEAIKAGARKNKQIYVHPHPFIDTGFRKMIERLDIYANRIANGIVGSED